MQKPGDEDGGVRPVELLMSELFAGRCDTKAAALVVVEGRGKNARRIEMRQTEPVDRAVHPDHAAVRMLPITP